ncbi:putative uridine kinase C227.14 [Aspergillus awamori]|uniref:Putative uridine kinase C227.14 n=1 Tax=Aspergillus awamori TaxID=105351 RepID=A0A401KXJ1_ASPAW|nr:putative uridine kinase C227.14 [Aspergillus awamori]
MDDQVSRLVDKIWNKFQSTPKDTRLLIAISGIPGSGKTELATMMANRINRRYLTQHPESPQVATNVPMDGYHLTRAQLSEMPDPAYAIARRGAAFTFDGEKFLQLVRALREQVTPETQSLYAPSFDHAVKDPVDDDILIPASCRVIFFEGNYLSLNKEPWNRAAELMDELWFVEVNFEVAKKRLIKRHVKAGIASDEAEAEKRVLENDLVNGKEIVDYRLDLQELVVSRSQSDPDNLQDICATNVGKVWAKIVEFCGDERQSALEQLKDTCTSAGYTIAYKPTASSDIASHSTALFSSTKPSSVIASSTGISTSSSAPDASSSLCPSTHPNQTISLGSADRGASAAAFAAVVFVGFAATL